MGTGRSFFARASVTALCALVGTTGAALVAGGTAAAATVVVNCPANNLQSAINAAPSGSTLRVSGTCVGNFTIPAGKNLTLVGPAVLDGNRHGVVLTVAPGATATVEMMTIEHGHGDKLARAGGILNDGNLTLVSTTVTDNDGFDVGGIANDAGTLAIKTSTISANFDGAVLNDHNGVAQVSSSTIEDNFGIVGAGFLNQSGSLTVVSSVIRHNSSAGGGGIFNQNGATLLVQGSQIDHLTAVAGGVVSQGGGVENLGVATITSTQITGNEADQGGGIMNNRQGHLTLTSSMLTQNRATGGAGALGIGGGVLNQGTFAQAASLIVNNIPDNCVGC